MPGAGAICASLVRPGTGTDGNRSRAGDVHAELPVLRVGGAPFAALTFDLLGDCLRGCDYGHSCLGTVAQHSAPVLWVELAALGSSHLGDNRHPPLATSRNDSLV